MAPSKRNLVRERTLDDIPASSLLIRAVADNTITPAVSLNKTSPFV
jgi:hypothetical protein